MDSNHPAPTQRHSISRLLSDRALYLCNLLRSRPCKSSNGPSVLLQIPFEMHLMVRDHIPPYDLYTHLIWSDILAGVGPSGLDKNLYRYEWHAEVYPPDFWKKICRLRGLNMPIHETFLLNENEGWKRIARYFVEHYERCTYACDCIYFHSDEEEGYRCRPFPDQNAPSVARAIWEKDDSPLKQPFDLNACIAARTKWVLDEFTTEPPVTKSLVLTQDVTADLDCKGFKTLTLLDNWFDPETETMPNMICYTRWTGAEASTIETPWKEHASTAFMFATDPPMELIELDVLGIDSFPIVNETGVTVWDVLWSLHDWLLQSIDIRQVDLLHFSYGDQFPQFKSLQPLLDADWGKMAEFIDANKNKDEMKSTSMTKLDTIREGLKALELPGAENPMIGSSVFHTLLSSSENPDGTINVIPLRDFWEEYGHVLAPYLGLRNRSNLMNYDSIRDFLHGVYFCGIKQTEPGSKVFTTEWASSTEEPVSNMIDRIVANKAAKRSRIDTNLPRLTHILKNFNMELTGNGY
ncbi:hypothetical protein QCA50_014373 [Cerrena zonata]|uniref:Uncharacterized protein n=1 Tax=Cerrena zonata TaxID=2478898 RepID=A0AAW0FNK9_9APHY